MTKISGSCLCGAVTYEGDVEPVFMGDCHCLDCRKSSGSGHFALILAPVAAINVKGEVKKYDLIGDSGATVTRHFCPTCGTQIYNTNTNPAMQGMMTLIATTLDDPEYYAPQMAVYAKRALSWDQPQAGIPHFAELPPVSS